MSQPTRSEAEPPRGNALLWIGAGAAFLGVLAGKTPAAAFGLSLVLVLLAVKLLLRASIARAAVTRTSPKAASEGDQVTVSISVENRWRLPFCATRVSEVFGPESLLPREVAFPPRIEARRAAEEVYSATCRRTRGIFPHGPMILEISDPFGWFRARRVIDAIDEFKVYPRLQRTQLPDRIAATLSASESARQALRVSDSDEFLSVRDYQPGDPLKRIHWKLFARRDYPVVREYLPTFQPGIAIFLDASRQLRFSGTRLSNFESSVRFAASLAARAAKAGFKMELRCGSQGNLDVPPGFGPPQVRRILETLIRVRTRTDDSFPAVLRRRADRLPRGGTAVVVLHPYLAGSDAFLEAAAGLVRRGLRVVCVVYGARPEALDAAGAERHARYRARLAAAGVELWSDRGTPMARAGAAA